MTRARQPSPLHAIGALLIIAFAACPVAAQNAQENAADAERLIKAMGVAPGSVVGEIGAGSGELTVAFAKALGSDARIYSNELNKDRLAAIRKRVDDENVKNVTIVEGKEDTANLPDACCDGIFMRDVYHHFSNPTSMNASILKALKPGGTLAIIDFTPPPPAGVTENPPGRRGEDGHHGITQATLEKELRAAGFEIVSAGIERRAVFVVARRPSGPQSDCDGPTAAAQRTQRSQRSQRRPARSFSWSLWPS
jgi:ubiquinone/menaquinone biosynthesis C-methylase UbiE